ncbi:hypothetical protein [Falsirhodobacter halotolerans]|uniref:hypothetical protein n=1 Tax=Falsirhodobacter halotolerans TaxID=1146892 RepID=UPI001FD42CE5|nr:hypothetical protein [Falsirhodobacter halotolerans]MCJ8139980.1 hypothetical protein [Falsirhodobacter halotolerans]
MMTDKHVEARRLTAVLSVEQDRAFGSGLGPADVRQALHEIAVREASLARLGIASIPAHAEPRAPALPPAPPGFDPDISAVVERLLGRKAEDGVGVAQATQIRAVAKVTPTSSPARMSITDPHLDDDATPLSLIEADIRASRDMGAIMIHGGDALNNWPENGRLATATPRSSDRY